MVEKLMYKNKEVKVYHVEQTALYKLAFASGGELPAGLDGMYTSPHLAIEALELFKQNMDKKVEA